MIRGVNKTIIEICDTGHECFERAILFVRPESERQSKEQLGTRAAEFLKGIKLRRHFYGRTHFWLGALRLTGAAAAGAAVAALILR